MLKLRDREAGILKDLPEKTFYVAYVIERIPAPSVATAIEETHRRRLFQQLNAKQRQQRQRDTLIELRRQAGKLRADDRFELNPGIKEEERTSSSE
jgi:hypothetical protein